MKRVRKKRGWVYWGALSFILILAVLFNAWWLTSPFFKMIVYQPDYLVEVVDGSACVALVKVHPQMGYGISFHPRRGVHGGRVLFELPHIIDIGFDLYVIPL